MNKNKPFNFGKNFARSQFSFITGTGKERRQALYRLKSLSFPDLCEAADYLEKNINPKIHNAFYGKTLPESNAEIGNGEPTITAKNLIDEINWTLLSIRKCASQVNLFLAYKTIFEENLLKGNYDEAERYLAKVDKEVCYSMWGLENRFLLNELKYSGFANKELLIEFNSAYNGTSMIKCLAHWLSIRAEQSLSVKRFITDLDTALSKIEGKWAEQNNNYYRFKLSFLNTYQFKYFTEILNWDSDLPVVDRYLSLRKTLISLLTSVSYEMEEGERMEVLKDYILNRISYLIKKVDDPILYKLKLFGNNKLFPAFEMQDSLKQIAIQDKFTLGAYEECEEGARQLLMDKPCQFDLYLIYIESLLYQKKKFSPIGNHTSLQNQILSETYNMLSASKNPHECGLNLLRISNNLASNSISYGITNFVLIRTKSDLKRRMFAGLNYNMANPSVYECFVNTEEQTQYLDFLSKRFPHSITLRFLRKTVNNFDSIEEFKDIIPKAKYLTELAKGFQQKGKLDEATSTWREILEEFKDMMPMKEVAVINLYDCFYAQEMYDNCIELYVDSYLSNPFIIEKVDPRPLLQTIKKNRFKVVQPHINVPIFYSLVNADENETHIAFEKFNLSQNVLTPSQFCLTMPKIDFIKLLLYLRITCTSEILKHSIHINGSKERLEERLLICEFLKANDQANSIVYEEEIKSITNILIIQQGRIELDESKIYVNEQGIIQNELREFEGIYNRFSTIAKISQKKLQVLVIEGGKLTSLNVEADDSQQKKIKYSTNPAYDIYLDLFEAIKEKFLYSKFGIVAYLSTRIRHGVLLGEIRPIFEKHRLITQKDGSSLEYKSNEYWNSNLFNERPITKSKIQDLLKDFSSRVDGMIYDLIKKHLQVQNDIKNPEGWFDYNFSSDELFWNSVRSATLTTDFNSFIKEVFEILWVRTDTNLQGIREKIQTTVADEFNQLFTMLETDVAGLLSNQSAQLLTTAINACSTDVQTTIMRISNWFKRSGSQLANFRLGDLIDVVVGYSDKATRLRIEKNILFDKDIKGEFYTHVADLLRIFIENILKHSNLSVPEIPVKIATKFDDNILELSIENLITDNEKVEQLQMVSSNMKMDLDQLLSENKSGYHKAYKILTSDLRNDENRFGTKLDREANLFEVVSFIYYKDLLA